MAAAYSLILLCSVLIVQTNALIAQKNAFPCTVPRIYLGYMKLAIVQWYREGWYRKSFITIYPGTKVEHGKMIYLDCQYNYRVRMEETFSQNTNRINFFSHKIKITCNDGKWDRIPACPQARCPLKSLASKYYLNVTLRRYQNGVFVENVYCSEGFDTIRNGEIICENRQWKYFIPLCKPGKCAVPKLRRGDIGEMKRGQRHEIFRKFDPGTKVEHGQILLLRCQEDDYEIPLEETLTRFVKITCNYGEWDRKPECYPARCRQLPPSNYSERLIQPYKNTHGSVVVYENICPEFERVLRNKTAECNFGKWIVTEGQCQNTRCSTKELQRLEGIKPEDKLIENEQIYYFQCAESYDLKTEGIKCENGIWKITGDPCLSSKDITIIN